MTVFPHILQLASESTELQALIGWDILTPDDEPYSQEDEEQRQNWGWGQDIKVFPVLASESSRPPYVVVSENLTSITCHESTGMEYADILVQVDVYAKQHELAHNISAELEKKINFVSELNIDDMVLVTAILETKVVEYEPESNLFRVLTRYNTKARKHAS
jgi:hypothetical protein